MEEVWICLAAIVRSVRRGDSTVIAVFAVGHSSWVSIDDVQEEVGGVVVGFTAVSFQMKTAFIHVLCTLCWSNKNVMFVPMSEKYAKALCAGPW